jgi:MFS family permease
MLFPAIWSPSAEVTLLSSSGGHVSDRVGRRKAVVLGCIWGIVGSALQVAAMNANWMLCARVIAGVGTGIISATIPVWGSELVAHDTRGMVVAFCMVVNYAGISSACTSARIMPFPGTTR